MMFWERVTFWQAWTLDKNKEIVISFRDKNFLTQKNEPRFFQSFLLLYPVHYFHPNMWLRIV